MRSKETAKRKKEEQDSELIEEQGSAEDEAMSKTLVLLNELELVFAKGGRSGPGGLEVDEFVAAYKKLG